MALNLQIKLHPAPALWLKPHACKKYALIRIAASTVSTRIQAGSVPGEGAGKEIFAAHF